VEATKSKATPAVVVGPAADRWFAGILSNHRAVHDIAWCFNEPSVVRRRFNEWLARRRILSWIFRRRRADQIAQIKESLGIVCEGTEVQNREDLDVLCLQEEGFGNITYHSYSEDARVLPTSFPSGNEVG